MDKFIPTEVEVDIQKIFDLLGCINNSNSKTFHYGELKEYFFNFSIPASDEDISSLLHYFNKLPSDYLQFLRYTNGLKLSDETGSELYPIKKLIEINKIFEYPKNFIIIGSCFDTEVHFLIDMLQSESKCIYVGEPIGSDFAYSLNCNFTVFLMRYISCYGSDFWSWGVDYNNNKPIKPWCY